MIDNVYFKGYFTVQSIDKQTNAIIDEYVDNNMIMEAARTSMSKIFAKISSQKSVSKLVLGTYGHAFGSTIAENIVTPKSSEQGFVKERNRLFSQYVEVNDSNISMSIKENDLIMYKGTTNSTGVTNGFYIWKGADSSAVNIHTTNFQNATVWQSMGTNKPFTYTLEFDLPGTTMTAPVNNLKEYGLIEYTDWNVSTNYLQDAYVLYSGVYYISLSSSGNIGKEPGVTANWQNYWTQIDFFDSGSTATVGQSGSSVTFTFDINSAAGNNGGNVVYTEAALYTGSDIFAMKTFKAKVKDDSVLLRIIWTITF
jgi:hypothetical protein